MTAKYKVYASVYNIPEQGKVKANLILILDKKGKLVDYLPGPATIDAYDGRFTKTIAKASVKDCVEQSFKKSVDTDDIDLITYEEASKMLFKLENR